MKPYYEENGIAIYFEDYQNVLSSLGKFDLLLVDPPYGLGEAAGKNKSRSKAYGSKSFGKKNSKRRVIPARDYGNADWDDNRLSDDDIALMCSSAEYQIIFGGNYFKLPPSQCWFVWDKVNSGDFADCELAWTNLNKAVRKFTYMWNGMLKEKPETRFHPTQKPLALMQWCIAQSPKRCKSLIDPCMGSGTTLVAAKLAGLRAVGIERDESYCEIAAKRLSQEVLNFTDLAPVPVNDKFSFEEAYG